MGTKYYFKLNDLPAAPKNDVFLTVISVDWKTIQNQDAFEQIIRCYGEFWASKDKGLNKYWDLFTLMHTKHQNFGKFQITCQATCWESLQAFIDHMDGTLHKANVSIETNPSAAFHPDARSCGTYPASQVYTGPTSKHKYSFMAMPWLTATQYCNGNPENSRFKNTGAYHTKPFTDHMLSTMYKYLTMDPSKTMAKFKGQTFAPQDAEVQIDSYGGKINTKSVESTA